MSCEDHAPVNQQSYKLGNEPQTASRCEGEGMHDERRDSEEEDGDHHEIVSMCLSLSGWRLNHECVGQTKQTMKSKHDEERNETKKTDPVRLNDGLRVHDA